jgi:hypothetical protein
MKFVYVDETGSDDHTDVVLAPRVLSRREWMERYAKQ